MPSKSKAPPTIREAVAERAAELGLSGYEIAKRTGGVVSQNQVRRYLRGDNETMDRLDAILRVLGLAVAPHAVSDAP